VNHPRTPIIVGDAATGRMTRRELLSGAAVYIGLSGLAACAGGSGPSNSQASQIALNADTPPVPAVQAVTTPAPAPQSTIHSSTTTAVVAEPETTVAPTTIVPGAPATYVDHGPLASDMVALTFHLGGDPKLAVELLDAMQANKLTATLFAIGSWVIEHPEITTRAVSDGHELGNHTQNHKSMLKLSPKQLDAEITSGGAALMPFIGSAGTWFRPSGTDIPNQAILDAAGRAGYAFSIGYDIDSRDFKEPGAEAVIAKVNSEMHAGAIVSLHFGHRDTIEALPAILANIATLNLRTVTITELLS
jgi:peptidoglycan/xylan/chitin deacetylase (PgdA/CDA1 family)